MGGSSAGNVTATTVSPSQIDISSAISSILKSAEVLVPALQTAGINLGGSLGQSNALLAGYGQVANNATTQMQQLLGMAPVDLQGQQLQQQLQGLRSNFLGSDMANEPGIRDLFSQVDSNVAAAVGLTDPTQRQAAYETALGSFNKLNTALTAFTPPTTTPGKTTDIDSLRSDSTMSLATANMIASKYGDGSMSFTDVSMPFKGLSNLGKGSLTNMSLAAAIGGNPADTSTYPIKAGPNGIPNKVTASQFIDWFKQQKAYTGGQSSTSSTTPGKEPSQNDYQIGQQVQDMMQNFQYQFSPTANQKMSPDDINQMIQTNPEYTAAFDTGLKAIQRSAAAGGMLSSGNTLKASADFGQQLAGTVYGDLYTRLAGLQSQTVPVAQQAAQNQIQNANTTYNAAIAPQQARSSALLNVGGLQGQTANNQAQLNQQAAIANQQAKLQADLGNQQAQMQSSGGFGQIAGSLAGGLLTHFGF